MHIYRVFEVDSHGDLHETDKLLQLGEIPRDEYGSPRYPTYLTLPLLKLYGFETYAGCFDVEMKDNNYILSYRIGATNSGPWWRLVRGQ